MPAEASRGIRRHWLTGLCLAAVCVPASVRSADPQPSAGPGAPIVILEGGTRREVTPLAPASALPWPAASQNGPATLVKPPMPVVIGPNGAGAGAETVVVRRPDGHFWLQAQVNAVSLPFFFDTGASFVTLTAEDAVRAGIQTGPGGYDRPMATANGIGRFASASISSLTVGAITLHGVPALVAQPGRLRSSLLGQSFMKMLAGYDVEGDRLILRGP